MELSLKPTHLKRYKDVARLVMKYGKSDVLKDPELEMADPTPSANGNKEVQAEPKAEELAADLEKMGPTFVKLGQLMSSRGEFLPPAYIEALARLQDNVEPFPYEDVERIVTEDLGVRISKAFADFDPKPLAAASLGQVHRATLRDGRQVVVKVQRPGIRAQIAEDIQALEEIAALVDKRTKAGKKFEFGVMLDEFHKTLLVELDYRREAQSLMTLADNLQEFERLVIPRPVMDLCSSCVITMDYIPGKKITSVSPAVLLEADGEGLADELFKAYLKQIFVDGFFHADPHPGNVFLAEDNRVALLDLGMVATLTPRLQQQLLQMVLAVSEGRSDEAADYALKISEQKEDFNERDFRRKVADVVARNHGISIGQMQIGKAFLEMARNAGETGVRVPPELTMLGKALLNLDGIGRLLAPEFDPNQAIRDNSVKIMNQRMVKSLSPANVFSSMLEMKDLVDRLPSRVNRILDAASNNDFGIKVDTGIKPAELMVGLQKVANRITVGLVIAALIVGAAMLMRIPSSWTVLGYPAIAMFFFLMAAVGALMLIYNTFKEDLPFSRKAKQVMNNEKT